MITIAEAAQIGAEIYHLKTAGKDNWPKIERVFDKVNAARAQGLDITADMYNYTAGATGLDAAMPPWVQEGHFADLAIFDADNIRDHATFAEPHQYASGVEHVIVNGVPVLLDGEHTGATPGRFVKGPGYAGQ